MARGKGEVSLDIGGRHYTLVFDMEAIAAFEDATDKSIFTVAQQLGNPAEPPKLSLLGSLLQAGLSRHHPDVTRADAMAMFTDPATRDALAEAFALAMPAAEEGEQSDPPKGRRGK
jgi:hypothetical protein